MKKILVILLLLAGIWVGTRPATIERVQRISSIIAVLKEDARSAFVDAPIEKAKLDFKREAEEQVRKDTEARMKEIDEAIRKSQE